MALDDALEGLAKIDPRQSRLVELRFFAGLTLEETAEVLQMSLATAKRDWVSAKAWLSREDPQAVVRPCILIAGAGSKNSWTSGLRLDRAERDEYLDRACEGDAELLDEVHSLIAAYEEDGDPSKPRRHRRRRRTR